MPDSLNIAAYRSFLCGARGGTGSARAGLGERFMQLSGCELLIYHVTAMLSFQSLCHNLYGILSNRGYSAIALR